MTNAFTVILILLYFCVFINIAGGINIEMIRRLNILKDNLKMLLCTLPLIIIKIKIALKHVHGTFVIRNLNVSHFSSLTASLPGYSGKTTTIGDDHNPSGRPTGFTLAVPDLHSVTVTTPWGCN